MFFVNWYCWGLFKFVKIECIFIVIKVNVVNFFCNLLYFFFRDMKCLNVLIEMVIFICVFIDEYISLVEWLGNNIYRYKYFGL